MTSVVFRLPDVGEGIAEVELVKWHVRTGDKVREGEPLADVMTDKATVELAAPVTGTVEATNGSEGTKLAVGAELATFEVEGGAPPEERKEPSQPKPDETLPQAKAPVPPSKQQKFLASPAVRARARNLGIDLSTLAGSGSGGRVEHADLDRLLKASAPAAPPPVLAPAGPGTEDVKIFGLRRRIAERMSDSKRRIPHFTYVEEVDVTELELLRKSLNEEDAQRPHLTVLPFLIRAIVDAAARHPAVNSHFDDANGIVRRFTSVHAGIATQTGRGLLVPVIRDAGQKDIWQIASDIQRLSQEARAGRSDPSELTGSTITVTSLGALGGLMATPIINPPEVAIIGVNRIMERPAVVGGAITIRKVMNLSSSFDHRIIDGFEAAAFIAEVKRILIQPELR